ncbi:hypothetical protein KAR91_82270 [Candidatus Pacearchaeota archaeon]|nr:hypothetical protein [Candidatus Pacearchaeota archaeon]
MKHDNYKKDKSRTAIISLIVIVLVLIGIMAWGFMAKPAINEYVLEKQQAAYVQGQNAIINEILVQIQQQGSVQIPVSETESVILDLRLPTQ